MPRETVFTPYPHDPATGPAPFQIHVGWQRDQDVQVGIGTPETGTGQYHIVDHVYGDDVERIGQLMQTFLIENSMGVQHDFRTSDAERDYHALLGRGVLDAVTGSNPFGTDIWWRPGRAQINTLIRLLRKARDAAYGRDE